MQTSETPCKDPWQRTNTLQLIKLINEIKNSNSSEKCNSNELYIHVANKLFEFGISRTYIQCKNKWRELVESYTEFKKNQSGEEPQFYSELEKVLSDPSADSRTMNGETVNNFGLPWSQYETSFLIKVMKVGNFVSKLKMEDPLTVYEQIAQYMQKVGPISRCKEDIQQRWRNLKQSYIKYIKGDLLHFKYFELMDALLDWEPNSVAFEEDQFRDGHEYGDETYQNPDDYEIKNAPSSKRALNWTHKETEILLDVVQKYNLKQMKRENIAAIFDECSVQLRLQSYKRSSEQCRVKFKHLKVKYFGALRKLTGGDQQPERYFFHFERMREIIQSADGEENNEFTQHSEEYEVEYLDDTEEGETFEKVFLKEQIQQKYPSSNSNNTRKGRVIWSQNETQHLLNLLKLRNVKRYCRRSMFEEIAQEMSKAGFSRSAQMCMIKWKNLRNQLYSCIRNMVEGKEEMCPFYDEIFEIVQKNGQVDISLISDQDQTEFDESEDGQFEAEDSSDKFCPLNTSPIDRKKETDTFPGDQKVTQTVESKTNSDIASVESTGPNLNSKQNEKKRPHSSMGESQQFLSEEKVVKKYKNSETNTTENEVDESKYVCNYKMDDVEHYCISLATTFKRLSKKRQAKLKIEIQKLLYSAEFDSDF